MWLIDKHLKNSKKVCALVISLNPDSQNNFVNEYEVKIFFFLSVIVAQIFMRWNNISHEKCAKIYIFRA